MTQRILILADGELGVFSAKTATSLLRYRPAEIVGVLDRNHAGRTTREVLGVSAAVPIVGTLAEGQQLVAEAQDLLIGSVLEGRSRVPVISRTVVHENAGRALVERAEGARMLVVGSARKGVVRRTLLGSVSEHCVRYAPAPVVVVSDESRLHHRARRDLQAVAEGPSGAG